MILATNQRGRIDADIQRRLAALVNNPTIETWTDAHGLIVNGRDGITIWQAVCHIDPTYRNIGRVTDVNGRIVEEWERIPDRALLERALFWATH